MSEITDEEIWRVAKVWYTRDPRQYKDGIDKGWWPLSEVEKGNYYKNAKAVLIALRRSKPQPTNLPGNEE
jgi:hypothetical protein